jgi:hypothetical protein
MGQMKIANILVPLLVLISGSCSLTAAQELKTVTQCRSYREAWYSSAHKDMQQLTVRELVSRANQLMTCGKEIDKEPVEPGANWEDAAKAAIANMGYAILSATYYQEAFNRAAWFLESKNLSHEFITDDAKRH